MNDLKRVRGWNLCFALVEQEQGTVGVGLRSREDSNYDVSKIAVALGGGGHKAAAGARIKGSIAEAKAKIKEAIKKTYPELKE